MKNGPYMKKLDKGYLVGFKRDSYQGPVVEVFRDGCWLNLITCPYEGHVMINIESLPMLKRALNKIFEEPKEGRDEKDQN